MISLTTPVSRVFLIVLALMVLYFVTMDIMLYSRVRNYNVRPTSNGTPYQSIIRCDINPLCTVTVKGLMLDHLNHYLLSPLAALMDHVLGISRSWTWVTPNFISASHVVIAVIGAKCISSDSLSTRRLGVLLFQVRMLLDDLDGYVARKRANIDGERSSVGSIGYLVDGICDGLGCVALMVGLFRFLSRSPVRKSGYEKLQLPQTSDSLYMPSKSPICNVVLRNMILVSVHLLMASALWNRYISLYQDLLETDVKQVSITIEELHRRQIDVFRSSYFWIIVLSWKIVNFHAAMDYLLLAVFLDKTWEYVRFIRWSSYVAMLLLVYLTELHFLRVYAYVQSASVLFDNGVPSSELPSQR